MIFYLKQLLRKTFLINIYIAAKSIFKKPLAQNDETEIITRLIRRFAVPESFIELGFSGWEFNCASLVYTWEGLLVDGDPYNTKIASLLYPSRVLSKCIWLTLENLDFIIEYARSRELGILSIDLDGNDYWFLEKIIETGPAIIIAEYNSSFGMRSVSVPYDPEFDRREKHESGTYFGASLSAIYDLASTSGYSLIEVSNSGISAFFVRKDLMGIDDYELIPKYAFREKSFSNGTRPSEQWNAIKHLPYVDVCRRDSSRI